MTVFNLTPITSNIQPFDIIDAAAAAARAGSGAAAATASIISYVRQR